MSRAAADLHCQLADCERLRIRQFRYTRRRICRTFPRLALHVTD